MRKIVFVLMIFVAPILMHAQNLQPVKWTFTSESLGNNEYNLIYTATIAPTWWTYSQFIKEGGPIPTTFKIEDNKNIELLGAISETSEHTKEGIEPMFDMFLKKFADKAVFVQKIKVLSDKPIIEGSVEFMCCDDMQCLPPEEIKFKISL
jgi:thiol:disulfide interchange protein DsbD